MTGILKEMRLNTTMKPEKVEISDRGVTMRVTLHPCNVDTGHGGASFSVHFPCEQMQEEIDALMEKAASIAGDTIKDRMERKYD